MENVTDQATEREPDVTHYAEGGNKLTWCGVDLAEVAMGLLTGDRRFVNCPGCAATLVDEQLAEPAPVVVDIAGDRVLAHVVRIDDAGTVEYVREAAPVVERRTVSLEVLTDELRAVAAETCESADERTALAAARVGIVFRIDGMPVSVPFVDTDWAYRSGAEAFASLVKQAQLSADYDLAELQMPTPDVLAALDGTPNAALWTAPLVLRADQVQPGWLVLDFPGFESESLITAVGVSCQGGCMWSACVPVSADTGPVHLAPWQSLTVRIPASVTR